jgi:hypothetical protein
MLAERTVCAIQALVVQLLHKRIAIHRPPMDHTLLLQVSEIAPLQAEIDASCGSASTDGTGGLLIIRCC